MVHHQEMRLPSSRSDSFSIIHKGPADRVSAAKIFPHSAFSRADIFWTLDTAYQITLGSPVPGPIFSMRYWAARECDVFNIDTVDKCGHKNNLWGTFCQV
jgi:hypothetical protein